MKPFLIRWLITTLAVLVVSQLSFVGVRADSVAALIVAGLFLGVMNAVVRPLLVLLSLPLLLLTMGLFFFVINACLLLLAGALISGFHVSGFGSAFIGSILISIVSWIFSVFFAPAALHGGGVRMVRMQPPSRDRQPYQSGQPGQSGGGMKTVEGRVIEADDNDQPRGGRA